MPGPPPKPDHKRRRANSEPGWVDIAADAAGDVPDIPKPNRLGRKKLGPQLWSEYWSTPWASMWGAAEVRVVLRLVELEVEWQAEGGSKVLSEIRQIQDSLGLTPKGRRSLRWRLVDASGVVEENGERVDPDDRRRRLRVVDSQAG